LHVSKRPLLDIDDLSVVLGHEAVIDTVSFCVHSGEFIGLIGPNGAGKTTLLRTVLNLQEPSSGTVSNYVMRRTGYIPQAGSRHNNQVAISVLEVVSLGSNGNVAAATKALREVYMEDAAGKRFDELSGGQQQRVLIAKALAAKPDLLFLDEPTTGIDAASQTVFFDILRNLQKLGITIVMVSHDIDMVLSLVTRVICLNRTVMYDGAPQHFEADEYLPDFYTKRHVQLHHRHEGVDHA
jgi:ABC-type Mn2+/Zn2+ transport system ATPase subunit